MSGEHAADKTCCACWLDRTIYRQLQKHSEASGKSINELVENWIQAKVRHINLTSADTKAIKEGIALARARILKARAKKAGTRT